MKSLPPYAQLLRLRTEEQGDDLRFVMPFHEDVVGRPGFLHGGAIAGLLEFAAFTALSRAIGDKVVKKPITVTVDYMRGGTEGDTFAEDNYPGYFDILTVNDKGGFDKAGTAALFPGGPIGPIGAPNSLFCPHFLRH